MGPNRIVSGWGRRRGVSRAATVLAALALAVPPLGCGKSGNGAEADPEKGSDAAILNAAFGQELATLDAYTRALPQLTGSLHGVGQVLRAQEQEYVDALTKGIRGLGGETEPEQPELDSEEAQGRAAALVFAYELESAALASYLDAAPRLFTAAPRTLAAALAAGHAQHLVVLRQALGAGLVSSIPAGFDDGEMPPPGRG